MIHYWVRGDLRIPDAPYQMGLVEIVTDRSHLYQAMMDLVVRIEAYTESGSVLDPYDPSLVEIRATPFTEVEETMYEAISKAMSKK